MSERDGLYSRYNIQNSLVDGPQYVVFAAALSGQRHYVPPERGWIDTAIWVPRGSSVEGGGQIASPFRLPQWEASMAAALDTPFQPGSSAKSSRAGESQTRTHDDSLSAFMSVRPRLFGIAYRMLGSAAGAEDIVQDVWVRWQAADRSVVRDAAAFLATTTTRLAINVMQSAHSRRERCAGPWLPEPVDTSVDPELGAERGEGLEAGILLLLEKLSPAERAAYILREAFDYTYRDIANVLRLEEANARQVVTRARHRVANGRRMPANWTDRRRLLDAFIAAARNGDVASLESVIASDIIPTSHRDRPLSSRTFVALTSHNRAPYPVNGSEKRATAGSSRDETARLA